MFKVTKNPIVTVPVPLIVNGEDQSFKATFEILPAARIAPGQLDTDEAQKAMLADATKNLDDIAGEDDKPLPFTPALLDAVLGRIDSRMALFTAYMKAFEEIARGNSPGLPAHGSTAA